MAAAQQRSMRYRLSCPLASFEATVLAYESAVRELVRVRISNPNPSPNPNPTLTLILTLTLALALTLTLTRHHRARGVPARGAG